MTEKKKKKSYARLSQNTHFIFFVLYGDHTYHVSRITQQQYVRTYVGTAAAVVYSRYPDRTACCLHIESFILPNDIGTPSGLPDSASCCMIQSKR